MTTLLAHNASYEKIRISLRYWLLGRNYHKALQAMEYASTHHTGTRRDNTPEFSHQIWQAQFLRTLEPSLINPEETLVTVFLHDVVEDYPVSLNDIQSRFGPETRDAVDAMSKVVGGVPKSTQAYFGQLALHPIASLCKGVDRIHNQASMKGAFSLQKQAAYIAETTDHILPMLKQARLRFSQQEAAYENVKHVLMSQIDLTRHFLAHNQIQTA